MTPLGSVLAALSAHRREVPPWAIDTMTSRCTEAMMSRIRASMMGAAKSTRGVFPTTPELGKRVVRAALADLDAGRLERVLS